MYLESCTNDFHSQNTLRALNHDFSVCCSSRTHVHKRKRTHYTPTCYKCAPLPLIITLPYLPYLRRVCSPLRPPPLPPLTASPATEKPPSPPLLYPLPPHSQLHKSTHQPVQQPARQGLALQPPPRLCLPLTAKQPLLRSRPPLRLHHSPPLSHLHPHTLSSHRCHPGVEQTSAAGPLRQHPPPLQAVMQHRSTPGRWLARSGCARIRRCRSC